MSQIVFKLYHIYKEISSSGGKKHLQSKNKRLTENFSFHKP